MLDLVDVKRRNKIKKFLLVVGGVLLFKFVGASALAKGLSLKKNAPKKVQNKANLAEKNRLRTEIDSIRRAKPDIPKELRPFRKSMDDIEKKLEGKRRTEYPELLSKKMEFKALMIEKRTRLRANKDTMTKKIRGLQCKLRSM